MRNTEERLKRFAEKFLAEFQVKTRPNGENFVVLKRNSGYVYTLLNDIIYSTHQMFDWTLPNDAIYDAIREALICIAEDGSEASNEPDIYPHHLLKWVGVPGSVNCLDEVMEHNFIGSFLDLVAYAQGWWKQMITDHIVSEIIDRMES